VARAERTLFFGALGMLLVSAALGSSPGVAAGAGGPALRAHVHAGSLGWLTLAVLAVAAGMAGDEARLPPGPGRAGSRVSWLTVAAVAAFVVADAAGSVAAEAWTGAAALAAILAFAGRLGVAFRRAGAAWTVPRLAMAGALAVLVAGSVIGAASAGAAASGNAAGAASLASSHSAALVVPFVILAATSIVEWAAAPSPAAAPATAGLVQVGALVLAAVAVITGVLAHDLALVEANIPLELGGIAIFLVRVGPLLLTAGWAASSRIWLVISTVALAVDAGLFAHVVFEIGRRRYVSIDTVPPWLLFAVDHVTFVAVGTTALLGAVAVRAGQESRWPAADVLAAAGVVAGIVATTAGIAAGPAVLERVPAAVLGVFVLAAVVMAALRAAAITGPRRP
jgi:hypothetical protein